MIRMQLFMIMIKDTVPFPGATSPFMLSLSEVTDLAETPRKTLGIRMRSFNTKIPRIGRSKLASHFYLFKLPLSWNFKKRTDLICLQPNCKK